MSVVPLELWLEIFSLLGPTAALFRVALSSKFWLETAFASLGALKTPELLRTQIWPLPIIPRGFKEICLEMGVPTGGITEPMLSLPHLRRLIEILSTAIERQSKTLEKLSLGVMIDADGLARIASQLCNCQHLYSLEVTLFVLSDSIPPIFFQPEHRPLFQRLQSLTLHFDFQDARIADSNGELFKAICSSCPELHDLSFPNCAPDDLSPISKLTKLRAVCVASWTHASFFDKLNESENDIATISQLLDIWSKFVPLAYCEVLYRGCFEGCYQNLLSLAISSGWGNLIIQQIIDRTEGQFLHKAHHPRSISPLQSVLTAFTEAIHHIPNPFGLLGPSKVIFASKDGNQATTPYMHKNAVALRVVSSPAGPHLFKNLEESNALSISDIPKRKMFETFSMLLARGTDPLSRHPRQAIDFMCLLFEKFAPLHREPESITTIEIPFARILHVLAGYRVDHLSIEKFKWIIDSSERFGIDINATTSPHLRTLLHIAIAHNNSDCVAALLLRPDVSLTVVDSTGRNPISLAFETGNDVCAVVSAAIERGINPDSVKRALQAKSNQHSRSRNVHKVAQSTLSSCLGLLAPEFPTNQPALVEFVKVIFSWIATDHPDVCLEFLLGDNKQLKRAAAETPVSLFLLMVKIGLDPNARTHEGLSIWSLVYEHWSRWRKYLEPSVLINDFVSLLTVEGFDPERTLCEAAVLLHMLIRLVEESNGDPEKENAVTLPRFPSSDSAPSYANSPVEKNSHRSKKHRDTAQASNSPLLNLLDEPSMTSDTDRSVASDSQVYVPRLIPAAKLQLLDQLVSIFEELLAKCGIFDPELPFSGAGKIASTCLLAILCSKHGFGPTVTLPPQLRAVASLNHSSSEFFEMARALIKAGANVTKDIHPEGSCFTRLIHLSTFTPQLLELFLNEGGAYFSADMIAELIRRGPTRLLPLKPALKKIDRHAVNCLCDTVFFDSINSKKEADRRIQWIRFLGIDWVDFSFVQLKAPRMGVVNYIVRDTFLRTSCWLDVAIALWRVSLDASAAVSDPLVREIVEAGIEMMVKCTTDCTAATNLVSALQEMKESLGGEFSPRTQTICLAACEDPEREVLKPLFVK